METGTRALETLLREPGQDALLYALVVQDAAWPLDPATPTAARRWIEWLTQLCRRELAEHGELPRRA